MRRKATSPMKNKKMKRAFTLAMCAVLVCASLAAIVSADTVEKSDGVFVYDGADLITAEAEADMNARAAALEAMTGSRLVIVTVRSMDGKDAGSFAPDLFDELELYGGENNAVLIVFALEEGYYHILPGSSISRELDVDVINEVFDAALVPETAGNYGEQLGRMFDDLLERIEKLYSVDIADYDPSASAEPAEEPEEEDAESERLTIGDYFMWVVILVTMLFR